MGPLYVLAGINHFVSPEFYVAIMPPYLPAALLLVYVSGFFEVAGGAGLLAEPTRRMAAWGLIALYCAVFPANINMAINQVVPTGAQPLPVWALWARLPLQFVLIAWAYRYTKTKSLPGGAAGL